MPAAGVIRPSDDAVQLLVCQLRRFDQRYAGISHFTQVVAGDFSGQADRNAAGAIEQRERQARGQLARLFKRAVVVGDEIDRAFVELIKQQAGDAGQACLGVAHGGGTVTITAAKVTLPIHQGVALAKVLRHANHGIVGGAVAVRVVLAQHIAHHAGAFDRLGATRTIRPAKAQTHA